MEDHVNWKDFVGQRVVVQKGGQVVRTGYVEDVTSTADVLWLKADGADPRALYEKAEGYRVLLASDLAG